MKSELEIECEKLGITIKSEHIGLIFDKEWQHDAWRCTLSYQGKSASDIQFKSGLGHRRLDFGCSKAGNQWIGRRGVYGSSLVDACKKNILVPQMPTVADVVYSLLCDNEAVEMSFDSWCDNFGFDNDSIKARDIYLLCQKNGDKIYNLLGSELIDVLKDKEH